MMTTKLSAMTGGVMKRTVSAIVAIVIASVTLQGCYGKMALTRKVYQVNGEVGEKHLRSLVTWAFILVPVYGISALADFVVFNTIEFWTGKNPVAQGEKSFQYAENGRRYLVTASKSGESVKYVINRYEGSRYLDTLSIDWDTRSGNSAASLLRSGEVTQYLATQEKGGVRVTSSGPALGHRAVERVALYK
jgi:hypothetical protein